MISLLRRIFNDEDLDASDQTQVIDQIGSFTNDPIWSFTTDS